MMPDQQRRALGAVQAEGLVCRQVAAGPDPHLQPAATHQVENRSVLRHPDRQLQGQGDDSCPQADPGGLRGDLGQKHEGRRQAAFVLVKMVLCDPGRIEAAVLSMYDLRNGQSVALGGVHLIEKAGEETQAYRRLRCRQAQPSGCVGAAINAAERGAKESGTGCLISSLPKPEPPLRWVAYR